MIDIINELKEYGITPLVVDPVADQEEAFEEYGITFNTLEEVKDIDTLVITVAHEEFKQIDIKKCEGMFRSTNNENKVLVDVKGILNREYFESLNYKYWRL